MLDLHTLRQRCSAGESFAYLFFWGHQPSKDGTITKSCLSQWYVAPFTIEDILYPTAEHWTMAAKSRLLEDEESLVKILNAADPKTAKALGRKVENFDGQAWTNKATSPSLSRTSSCAAFCSAAAPPCSSRPAPTTGSGASG